jgi:hypothetical protein
MREVMLTTVDNPFNPFDNFEEWFKIDMQFGYNTCALLARLAPAPADSLPDSYNEAIKEQVIDRWVKLMPQTYKKIVRDVPEPDWDAIVKAEEEYSDKNVDDNVDDTDRFS